MSRQYLKTQLYLFLLAVICSCHQEISDPPVALFDATVIQSGSTSVVEFTNKSSNATNYFWDLGDGSTTTETNPRHTYNQSGDYSVKLIATGMGGSSGVTSTVKVAGPVLTPVLTLDFNNASDTREWTRQYNTNGNTGEVLSVAGGYLNMRTTGSLNDVIYGLKHSADLNGLTRFEIVTRFGKEELAYGNPRYCHVKFPVREYGGRDLSLDILYQNGVRSLRVGRYGKEPIIRSIPTTSCSEITFTVRSVNGKFEITDDCTNTVWFTDTEITLAGAVGLDVFYNCAAGACPANSYGSFAIDYIRVRKY